MFDTLRNNSKIVVYLVVIAFVVSGGFMGYGAYLSNFGGGGGGQAPRNQNPSVIAEVNGMEISQQEYFSLLQQQAPQSNLSGSQIIPFRYNVLELLIERKLISAQAEVLDVDTEVSEAEIEDQYQNILEENQMTDEEIADILAEQGYTIGDLRDDIRQSLEENKRINETIDAGIETIEVSDEEIEELYNQRYPEEDIDEEVVEDKAENDVDTRPALSEVRDDLEREIYDEKRNQAVDDWLVDLKDNADITINDPVLSAYHDLENQNYEAAAAQFSTFIEQEDTDPIFYAYLAEAYQGQDNPEEANNVFNNAVERYPDNNDLRFNYAEYLAEQDNNEDAVAQLNEISAADDDFMTHYQLYMLYSRLGAEEEAQAAMEEIQRISQDMQTQTAPDMEESTMEELEQEAEGFEEEIEIDDGLDLD